MKSPVTCVSLSYEELLVLRQAVETLYREEIGQKEKAPYYDSPMSTDMWAVLVKLRKQLRRFT